MAAPYVWEHDEPPAGHGSHPVVLVDFDDALAYCRWLSESLGRAVDRLVDRERWARRHRARLVAPEERE